MTTLSSVWMTRSEKHVLLIEKVEYLPCRCFSSFELQWHDTIFTPQGKVSKLHRHRSIYHALQAVFWRPYHLFDIQDLHIIFDYEYISTDRYFTQNKHVN